MIGFYLGGIYVYSGNILGPVMVHCVYNIFAINLLTRIYSGKHLTTG
jgi:membrane protease YdiL (CAAX protease family)